MSWKGDNARKLSRTKRIGKEEDGGFSNVKNSRKERKRNRKKE